MLSKLETMKIWYREVVCHKRGVSDKCICQRMEESRKNLSLDMEDEDSKVQKQKCSWLNRSPGRRRSQSSSFFLCFKFMVRNLQSSGEILHMLSLCFWLQDKFARTKPSNELQLEPGGRIFTSNYFIVYIVFLLSHLTLSLFSGVIWV